MKRTIVFLSLIFLLFEGSPAFSQHKYNNNITRKKGNIPNATLDINLLDAAMYGPIIAMEFKISHPNVIMPWFRYSYAGVLSQYQWTNFDSTSKYSPTSLALGLEYKRYLMTSSRNTQIYYGPAIEMIHEKGLHNIDPQYDYEYEQIRWAIAGYVNFGYKFKFKNNFFMNLGILPGVAFDIKNTGYYTTGASEGLEYDTFNSISFIGMIDFAFGWEISK